MSGAPDGQLDDFFEELDSANMDVKEDELDGSWDQLEEGPSVVSAPSSTGSGRSPAADSPPLPAVPARVAAAASAAAAAPQAAAATVPAAVRTAAAPPPARPAAAAAPPALAAAATAIKDVSDLGESFQQVLQEVADASDDDESAPRVVRAAPPPGAASPLPPDKALTSLWGWGATLASKVEAAAASVSRELAETAQDAQPAVAAASSKAAAGGCAAEFRLGSTLGALSRTAQGLLEQAIAEVAPRPGGAAGGGGGEGGDEPLSFADALYIAGGRSAQEDLESLSNDSARMANRLRSLLPGEGRTALEGALAVLAPVLDLKTPHLADAAPAGTLPSGVSPATLAAVAAGHGVVAELAAAGCERADALAAAVADTAAQLVAAPAGEAAEGGTAGGDAPAGSGTPAGRQPGGATPAVQAAVPPAAAKAMAGLHADGVRTVAELCSLCLERLLGLGRSLSAFYRYAKPASDGIAWPAGGEGAGLLLRGQALRMLEELQGLGAAYGAALASAGSRLDAAAGAGGGKACSHAAAALAHALQTDSNAATARLHDGSRALLQVVWLTAVPRQTLEELL
ncbi:putative GTPase activation [Micractinium conductrix]|uniref:GTPase activation n=1 Tax=Micractinium conductrix TaxID=554055 RepID=A0A2P6V420_9CHLO|nr:putative GTPase activation [Micractinium conductrix]|eukprot:PSC68825.1 putative GTPase activation [Micractinium conductrix]